jgi:hypothetical protein
VLFTSCKTENRQVKDFFLGNICEIARNDVDNVPSDSVKEISSVESDEFYLKLQDKKK